MSRHSVVRDCMNEYLAKRLPAIESFPSQHSRVLSEILEWFQSMMLVNRVRKGVPGCLFEFYSRVCSLSIASEILFEREDLTEASLSSKEAASDKLYEDTDEREK